MLARVLTLSPMHKHRRLIEIAVWGTKSVMVYGLSLYYAFRPMQYYGYVPPPVCALALCFLMLSGQEMHKEASFETKTKIQMLRPSHCRLGLNSVVGLSTCHSCHVR